MSLSTDGRPARDVGKAVVRRAVESGVDLIDTADVYALDQGDLGHNERLVAEALREMGVEIGDGTGTSVLVATKGGMTRPGGRWERDGRPEHLREACHASLRALGVERIPLYQLHCPDPGVPFMDSIGALARLREEGKIDWIGLSNVDSAEIREAASAVPVTSVQNAFSPWDIGLRRSRVVDLCEREGIVFLAHSPLGGIRGATALAEPEAVSALSRELEATPQELALAWLLAQASVVVPIPGARRVSSVESSVRALSLRLDASVLRRLKRAFRSLPASRDLGERVLGRLASVFRR
jgi:aryl-alcohol dehydrogenase-like predicted oxidoreductase